MKKRIIIISIIVFVVAFISIGYIFYNTVLNDLSGNVKLDTDKYLTSIEVKSKSNFIIFINKKKKISNIIFLNGHSIKSLYKQNIEGKDISKGVELIVDKLKNSNEFNDDSNFQLIDYGNTNIYNEIKTEFNKEFVVYGVDKAILDGKSILEEKLESLNYNISNDQKDNLKELYNHSLNMISKYRNMDFEEKQVKEEDISLYASNVYNKLLTYKGDIITQAKDSITGIDITTINATGDYQNELYASIDSWYYIENNQVFAYIKFDYNSKIYEYCFKGTVDYIEGVCQ